jgi:hypothetical protein
VPEELAWGNMVETFALMGAQAPACPRAPATIGEMRRGLGLRCVWLSYLNLWVFEGT